MLHILLWILKIIGILLAVVLGILFVVFLCVLFVPIRYTIKADGKLGEEQPLRIKVKVSWLLHIINAAFIYPEKAFLRVRILCFTVFNSSKQKKKEESKAGADKTSGEEQTNLQAGEQTESGEKQANLLEQSNTVQEQKSISLIQDSDGEPETEERKGISAKISFFFSVIKKLWNRFIEAVKNIEYTIRRICDRIKKIIENIQYYTDVIQSDVFRKAWQDCKKQLLRIMRMLKPSKCRINLMAGTGDPSSTGQLLSVYGMLYPLIGNHVFLQTDFENQIVEGDLYIKGKIKIWVFLWAAFKLFIDKDLRRVLKLLKKEEI